MSFWSVLNSEKAKPYKTVRDFTVMFLLGIVMFSHMILCFLACLPLENDAIFSFPKGAKLEAFLKKENVAK